MPFIEPGALPVMTRRQLFGGGAALALLAAAPACSTPPAPPAVDELESQLASARQDSDLATAAAVGAAQPYARALTLIASQRAQHAAALTAEIARLALPSSTTSEPTSPTTTTPAAAAPPPPVSDVITALRSSADSARQLATTTTGYRAGLLGSIAAACTVSYTVTLEPTPAAS